MASDFTCSLCRTLPEGHGVLSAPDGSLARLAELRLLGERSDERVKLLTCPHCGMLYRLVITPIDIDYWAAVIDPYDIPTEPHRSLSRLAPSQAEAMLTEYAPERIPEWTEERARHARQVAESLGRVPVPLADLPLRHAIICELDVGSPDAVVRLLRHGDLRVVLYTAQALLYPRCTDERIAPTTAARLKNLLPALRSELSEGLERCLDSPAKSDALELVGYARDALDTATLLTASRKRAEAREQLTQRLTQGTSADGLDAIHDLLMNLDEELRSEDSTDWSQARPELCEKFATALHRGFEEAALRRRAVGIVQQWTIAARHIELFRPVLPDLARRLGDPPLRTYVEDALLFHFPFYDAPTHRELRTQLVHPDPTTAGSALRILQSWASRLRDARRPDNDNAARIEADLTRLGRR